MHALQLVRTHTQKGAMHSASRSRKYTLTPNWAHTQKTFPLFFSSSSSLPRLSAPPLSALHRNTTPSRCVQICSSIQLTVQSLSVSVQITSSSAGTLTKVAPARNPAHLFKIAVPKHRRDLNSATQLRYSGAGKWWVAGCGTSVERALKFCHLPPSASVFNYLSFDNLRGKSCCWTALRC